MINKALISGVPGVWVASRSWLLGQPRWSLFDQSGRILSPPIQHRFLSRNRDQKDNRQPFKTKALTCPRNRGNSTYPWHALRYWS